jgi:Protein of unknown function (DUF3553)
MLAAAQIPDLRPSRRQAGLGIGVVRSVTGTLVTVKLANRGTVAVDTRSARLSIVRVKPRFGTWPAGD